MKKENIITVDLMELFWSKIPATRKGIEEFREVKKTGVVFSSKNTPKKQSNKINSIEDKRYHK